MLFKEFILEEAKKKKKRKKRKSKGLARFGSSPRVGFWGYGYRGYQNQSDTDTGADDLGSGMGDSGGDAGGGDGGGGGE